MTKITELGLSMVCSRFRLLQEEDLAVAAAAGFHIYMICSRPRISLDMSRLVLTPDTFSSAFRVHDQDRTDIVPFSIPRMNMLAVTCEYPYTEFSVELRGGGRHRTKAALFAMGNPEMAAHLDLEVLYVGQSFGNDGERDASSRLTNHKKLQKISAETLRLRPDREVWIVLLDFEETMISSFDGRIPHSDADNAADDEHVANVFSKGISEAHKINFTEAALIKFFKPPHNETFKESFPNPNHSSYRECYEIDLNMVCVELDTDELHARLFSASQSRSWFHMAMFPLHDPKVRRGMFDFYVPETTSPST